MKQRNERKTERIKSKKFYRKTISLNTILKINYNGDFNLYLYIQSTGERKSPGEIHNCLTHALTDSHMCTTSNKLSQGYSRTNQQMF